MNEEKVRIHCKRKDEVIMKRKKKKGTLLLKPNNDIKNNLEITTLHPEISFDIVCPVLHV